MKSRRRYGLAAKFNILTIWLILMTTGGRLPCWPGPKCRSTTPTCSETERRWPSTCPRTANTPSSPRTRTPLRRSPGV